MAELVVVADYAEEPAEGIQVISKTLVDGLRREGHPVRVVAPRSMPWMALWMVLRRPRTVIFTHGPGKGVVLWSRLLRLLTSTRIVWVATRPDLRSVPAPLKGRRTAHVVVGNSARPELLECAPDAQFVQQFLGIDPKRLEGASRSGHTWQELNDDLPTALHVGHLRRSRGLDLLSEAQRLVGPTARIMVLGSPTFPPDDGVVDELLAAGVTVRREYVNDLASLYRAVDLYLFPVRSEAAGAIDLPLGVLEAVACGTPVVSTPFGSLPQALSETTGVHFVEPEHYPQVVADVLRAPFPERPGGLPPELHADRVTGAVLQAIGPVSS